MATPLRIIGITGTVLFSMAVPLCAQQPPSEVAYSLPPGWVSKPPRGLVREPALLSRVATASESALERGPRDGWYVQTGTVITGGGWIAGGPGYRQALFGGVGRVDVSVALSSNLYRTMQASFELPKLAHGRLSLAAGASYQDALQVRYFGAGNNLHEADGSAYRFHNADVVALGRLRAGRWLSIDGRVGWIPRPTLSSATGSRVHVTNTIDTFTEATAPGISTQPPFIHGDIAVHADALDHPGHPTSGGEYRASIASYLDRDTGIYSFRRYEIEGAQFIPLGTRRWILGVHAWEVISARLAGAMVPFYLLPSLGGGNTLRGYVDYRFHDNQLQLVNVESRVALLTHMDVAVFVDAGKVASKVSDLDFRHLQTSYGAGIRFHSARSTLLRVDAGHGAEGWQVFVKLSDSFKRTTPAFGRRAVVPFVP